MIRYAIEIVWQKGFYKDVLREYEQKKEQWVSEMMIRWIILQERPKMDILFNAEITDIQINEMTHRPSHTNDDWKELNEHVGGAKLHLLMSQIQMQMIGYLKIR